MGVESEGKAIAEATALIVQRRSGTGKFAVARVGERLQEFLTKNGLTLRDMVDRNLGQEVAGTKGDPTPRDESAGCLRSILETLCCKGNLALALDRCILPPGGIEPHRDPRGLLGFPESVSGIYPAWLVPQQFQKAIDSNAAIPEAVRKEFRAFAEKAKVNEASLRTYWDNTKVLCKSTGIASFQDLKGQEGAARLQKAIVERRFHAGTSTLVHWKRLLKAILKAATPFSLLDADGDPLIKIPTGPAPIVIREGAKFVRNKKQHKVIEGIITECRILPVELKRLVHYTNPKLKDWRLAPKSTLGELFRVAQEDALVKFLCIIKDRPVEAWAHNWGDWKLYLPQPNDPDSQLFNGDGAILNNYRESVRKQRPDKPFPMWLAKALKDLWAIRRAHFAQKDNCDQTPSSDTGLIRPGIALWVNPRTGQRLSQNSMLEMIRRGLFRGGLSEPKAQEASGYWFRKGVISTEWREGKLNEHLEKTGGHKKKTAHRFYVTEEMVALVVHERKTYWQFLGINKALSQGDDDGVLPGPKSLGEVKHTARKLLERLKATLPGVADLTQGQLDAIASGVAFDGAGRLTEREAAAMVKISLSTARRWAELGLLEKFREGGRVFYLRSQVKTFLDTYVPIRIAKKLLDWSDSYVRRLCREKAIAGAIRVGKKSYLVPWIEVRRRMRAEEETVTMRKQV